MGRQRVGRGAVIACLLAVSACNGQSYDRPPAGVDTPPATPTVTATAPGGPAPVDPCALVDLTKLKNKGSGMRSTSQFPSGGSIPSDHCPIWREGERVSVGTLAIAMIPFSSAALRKARPALTAPLGGVGDEAFTANLGERRGLYARRGTVVLSVLSDPKAIPRPDQIALVKAAFERLPAGFEFTPDAWPPQCGRLDRRAAAEVLGAPISATRGSVSTANISCTFFAAPGRVEVFFRREARTRPTDGLIKIPGVTAEAYLSPRLQSGWILGDGRELAFVEVWSPDADRSGSMRFRPLDKTRPEIAALFQNVADAVPG